MRNFHKFYHSLSRKIVLIGDKEFIADKNAVDGVKTDAARFKNI